MRLTGWNRDHARRALRRARGGPARPRARPVRPPRYGQDVQAPLEKVWATFGGLCGKRLAPFMAEAVQAMERFGELALTEDQRGGLLQMSAATIDRRLAPARRRLGVKGRSGTKPGTLLKRHIPIRTFAQWDEDRPGFLEVDLVAHDGGNASGGTTVTYPSKAALAAIKAKVRTISQQGRNLPLRVLLHRLNPVLRGWAYHFRYGVSAATFGYLSAFAWRRVIRWLARKHPRANWGELRRRYLPGWWPEQDGVRLFNPRTVATVRYRYRGAAIPSPWAERMQRSIA